MATLSGMDLLAQVDGVAEHRVALFPGGVAAAGDRRLRRWRLADLVASTPVPSVDATGKYPRPGPLRWVAGPGVLAWGPAPADATWAGEAGEPVQRAAKTLGMDPMMVRLRTGALAPDGERAALLLDQAQHRVRASRDPGRRGPESGLAMLAADGQHDDVTALPVAPASAALAWGDDGIVLHTFDGLLLVTGDGTLAPHPLPGGAGQAVTAVAAGGTYVAAAVPGALLLWAGAGHQPRHLPWPFPPARTIAVTSAGMVVAAGDDEVVRLLEDERVVAEAAAGGPVRSLCADETLVAVKVGDHDGRIVVLRR